MEWNILIYFFHFLSNRSYKNVFQTDLERLNIVLSSMIVTRCRVYESVYRNFKEHGIIFSINYRNFAESNDLDSRKIRGAGDLSKTNR